MYRDIKAVKKNCTVAKQMVKDPKVRDDSDPLPQIGQLSCVLCYKMRYSRDDDVLCCCEYYNNAGERAHLLGLLCDCVEVDDAFDRLIRGEKWHQQQLKKICTILQDR